MLQIHTLVLGMYQVNCYVVHKADSDRCVVIDPGYHPEKIDAFLQEKGLHLEAILLTHGHFDHVGGVKGLAEDCKVYLHPHGAHHAPGHDRRKALRHRRVS